MLTLNMPIAALLNQWQQQGVLTSLDRHFAIELSKLESQHAQTDELNALFLLICALLSQKLSNQHTCLVINSIDLANPMGENIHGYHADKPSSCCQINITHGQLLTTLCQFDAVGSSGDNKPLILDLGRLYLNKYHHFEINVAAKLRQLASHSFSPDINITRDYLTMLFPAETTTRQQPVLNWQKIATATALTKALAVITGGPGTGKTTTVTKLLLLLLTQSPLTLRLVAPTGKAAARLSESIKASKARLLQQLTSANDGSEANNVLISALNTLPEEASTLHRLLGVIPQSHQFRHNKTNPLRLDLLVVDEASMVDLPMMHKLLDALPSHARLILLGDQDQLASVEAGSVLADMCLGLKANAQESSIDPWFMRYSQQQAQLIEALTGNNVSQYQLPSQASNTHIASNMTDTTEQQLSSFGDSLCMLRHSHRFAGDAGIGRLANAVNQGDIAAISAVWNHGYNELHWYEHQHVQQQGKDQLVDFSVSVYRPYLEMIQYNQKVFTEALSLDDNESPEQNTAIYTANQIIDSFNQYRLLCAMRSGEFGIDGMNASLTLGLQQAQLINPNQEFYLGRPIIIQSNDYNLGLFNGDIGLILQDEQQPSRLMAHFIQADGSLLKVLPARLPKHDSCYAMTVHKSQGSEFDTVGFVLPQQPSTSQWQLLTKELVYTAITRAKNHFYCLGNQRVFERACKQVTHRSSGLGQRLWG
ncbi:exodeoxyribonuclease V subunit alpha [Shewanella intestini]|uniref:RecBCD enzyme subunit RecD n=1 Tax=Shewanella intestini TaxID=2017544 RepID=A0ABS5I5D8_9GAMM|nr:MULTISPECIES: exodeoxyribonuclease V subunit alpha [Shewanella]MBR9729237.1 exodeoxyribonuclease V subunit alpha [Shewanella intestini]MRG35382.1 exodeoxyribonuclease V subunit alpha [Shewanella sp. XMDDZSB0408]